MAVAERAGLSERHHAEAALVCLRGVTSVCETGATIKLTSVERG